MKPDDIRIEFAALDDPFESKTRAKKRKSGQTIAQKLEYIFANGKFAPVPASVDSLAVFGSRTLYGQPVIALIEKHASSLRAKLIVTAAEPAGVCKSAQKYAQSKSIPLQVHFLDKVKYARGVWEHRSDHVICASDLVLFIHDGKSKGTYNEVLRAIRFKKPFIYERLSLDDGILMCEL